MSQLMTNPVLQGSRGVSFHSGEFVRTKIVATHGPACAAPEKLRALVEAGVNVFRVNMAHGSRDEHMKAVQNIRAVSDEMDRPLGILIDLAGPKMRLGILPNGRLECVEGAEIRFIRGEHSDNPAELVTTYEPLVDDLAVGDRVMLADGTVGMEVIDKQVDHVVCRVTQGGLLRSRQGVNLPGAKISAPAMSEEDRDNAYWAADVGIDFIGLSFVRTPQEVLELKEIIQQQGSHAQVVAKIEKPEALSKLKEIVEAADAVMVARGDLGVEIDIAEVPMAQKRIVRLCNEYQKPVIIATQMLDSMQRSVWPTRAETTDVANAILDGADACMLSGETAIGDYPVEAVEMLRRIAQSTETVYRDRKLRPSSNQVVEGVHPVTQAVVFGAGRIARQLDVPLVVIASHTGATALAMSKQKGHVPIIGISDTPSTLRKMCLYWGVYPIAGAPATSVPELLAFVDHWGRNSAGLKSGERLLVITGAAVSASGHNIVIVHEME